LDVLSLTMISYRVVVSHQLISAEDILGGMSSTLPPSLYTKLRKRILRCSLCDQHYYVASQHNLLRWHPIAKVTPGGIERQQKKIAIPVHYSLCSNDCLERLCNEANNSKMEVLATSKTNLPSYSAM